MPARAITHVDLDAFFVAVELTRRPELRGKPVVVGGDPGGRGVVSTASYEARVYGIHSGMALATARRLCPEAVFLRGHFHQYEKISREFHQILRDYSPVIESGGLDEAYLDLTGCAPVIETRCGPHPPEETARLAGESIRGRVKEELSLAASVGIATSKSVAKIASDAAKPDGLLEVPPGEEAAFLAPRPTRDLPGLGPKAEAVLARFGVRTLGRLAGMPASTLQGLFGAWGPALAERARGIDPTPVAYERGPPKSISREGTYQRDVDDAGVLRAALRGYAESIGAELRRRGLRARCVTIKLRYGDFTTLTRRRTIAEATHGDEDIYRTAADLLERELRRDRRAVRLLGLGVTQLVTDAVQLALFRGDAAPRPSDEDEALLRSIDQVRSKYGRRALQTGLTFFDPFAGSEDWEPERRTGLSSQIGLGKEAERPRTERPSEKDGLDS